MSDCKTFKTPLQSVLELCGNKSNNAVDDVTSYRQVGGSLLHFSITVRAAYS